MPFLCNLNDHVVGLTVTGYSNKQVAIATKVYNFYIHFYLKCLTLH